MLLIDFQCGNLNCIWNGELCMRIGWDCWKVSEDLRVINHFIKTMIMVSRKY